MIRHVPFPTFRRGKKAKNATGQVQAFPWLVLGIAMLCLLTLLSLYQSSQTDAAHQRIRRLQVQKMALEQQNAQLVKEITTWEDLNWMLRRADELGFVSATPDQTVYVPIRSVAYVARAEFSESASEAQSDSGWRKWLSKVRGFMSTTVSRVFP